MKIINHLLDSADYIPSPNHNSRPEDMSIDLLVIHNISLPPKKFGGTYIQQLFTNCLVKEDHPYFLEIADLKVSAHLVIYRSGNIQQFVPFNLCAWHAGISSYLSREKCNDFSIGIELEGTDDLPYTDGQYQQLATVTKLLLQHYPSLSQEHIVGHCDIAPTRKTDPGQSFDWSHFRKSLL